VLGIGSACITVYFFLPALPQDALFVAVGAVGALLIVGGAIRNLEGSARLPWYLLAAGQLAFSTGDGVLNFYPNVTGHEPPFPSSADIVYLAGYPFLGAGIYLLVRRVTSAEGRFAYVDAALITGAFALVQWVFLIQPYVHQTEESVYARIVLMAYPAVDVLLLAVLARFFAIPSWRAPAYVLLMAAVFLLIAADEFYLSDINGYVSGQWSDSLWLLSYLLFAVTALTPSIRTVSNARSVVLPRLSAARLGLVALALVTAPIVLIMETATERDPATLYLIGAAAAALAGLALVRIVGLVRGVERVRAAEQRAREEVEDAHQLLAEQNEQLVVADRMKDEFIGMISHDLRTPLVSATGFLELLSDGDAGELNDEQRRYVGFVQRATDRLLRQIEDLLVAASLQAGRFALDLDAVALAHIAEEAVEGQRSVAVAKGVGLRLVVEPAPLVQADPLRLAQVIDNLLSNAIKFTPKGGTVEVRVLADGDRAVLEVADSGIGIPDSEQSTLFERFFRTSNAVERRIPGTGLGLYIVRSLVQAHGGVITLRSVAGEGSTFRVELPTAAAAPSPPQAPGSR
jgi:signal transduction histidine kinase